MLQMQRALLVLGAAAAIGAPLAAQQIQVSLSGWTKNPCHQEDVDNFSSNNGDQGAIIGGASAYVGTAPYFCYGQGSVQGYLRSGNPVFDHGSATAGCIEYYALSGGTGNVSITVTVHPGQSAAVIGGTQVTGFALGSAAFTCPLFGWLRGSIRARAVYPPTLPIIATPPVSATASASGLSTFSVNMSTGGSAEGGVNAIGDSLLLSAQEHVDGTVTLS